MPVTSDPSSNQAVVNYCVLAMSDCIPLFIQWWLLRMLRLFGDYGRFLQIWLHNVILVILVLSDSDANLRHMMLSSAKTHMGIVMFYVIYV